MDAQGYRGVVKGFLTTESTPLEAAGRFLDVFVRNADGMAEVQEQIRRTSAVTAIDGLVAIELVLARPQPTGTYAELVRRAVWRLEDPSDRGAKAWLGELASLVRERLGEHAPPTLVGPPYSPDPVPALITQAMRVLAYRAAERVPEQDDFDIVAEPMDMDSPQWSGEPAFGQAALQISPYPPSRLSASRRGWRYLQVWVTTPSGNT